ncbi:MAG: hypothetical protein K6A63_02940 [Acholeplasmatales bacterium]|nr:hypothetical protein [Acholeplasmatales bacterium]
MLKVFIQVLFHLVVTAVGVLLIVFGILDEKQAMWVAGIIVLVTGNIAAYVLLFLLGLIMIPFARSVDSETGVNANRIQNRKKTCNACGETVDFSVIECPKCKGKLFTEVK